MTAIELAPEEARCHRIMGLVRCQLGEFAAAEQDMRHAVELNPYDAELDGVHVSRPCNRGRAAEALEWLDRAVALNPLHPYYYFSERSIALYLLGRYDEAAADLERLPHLSVRRETRMAATLALAGRPEEAARHLDRAEALEPGWPHLEATASTPSSARTTSSTCERVSGPRWSGARRRARGRRRRRCRRDADARRSGEGGLGLVDDGAEGGGLVDGEVGEDLAVDLDAGLGEAVDQAGVGEAGVVLADGGVDPLDPEGAELALADLAVAGRVLQRLVNGLLGGAVVGRAGAVVAGGLLDDLAVAGVGGRRRL